MNHSKSDIKRRYVQFTTINALPYLSVRLGFAESLVLLGYWWPLVGDVHIDVPRYLRHKIRNDDKVDVTYVEAPVMGVVYNNIYITPPDVIVTILKSMDLCNDALEESLLELSDQFGRAEEAWKRRQLSSGVK